MIMISIMSLTSQVHGQRIIIGGLVGVEMFTYSIRIQSSDHDPAHALHPYTYPSYSSNATRRCHCTQLQNFELLPALYYNYSTVTNEQNDKATQRHCRR